jgi:hypothetical protein
LIISSNKKLQHNKNDNNDDDNLRFTVARSKNCDSNGIRFSDPLVRNPVLVRKVNRILYFDLKFTDPKYD